MDEYKSLKKFQKKNENNGFKNNFSRFITQILVSIILLLVGLIVTKNTSLRDELYKYIYENNLSFSQIEEFYKKYFGNILPEGEKGTEMVLSEKLDFEREEKLDSGVRLYFSSNKEITAFLDGLVIFIGEKEGYGKTLVLEQTDGVEAWFVNVEPVDLKIYDYVQKGEVLASSKENYIDLYFKKKGEVVSYQDYIY